MRLYSLDSAPFKPVTHDPELKKQVIVPDGFSCVRHLSHITLRPGSTASRHAHEDAYEVFYCLGGEVVFRISGKDILLIRGSCLVVEPKEVHEIPLVREVTELLYFHAAALPRKGGNVIE